MLTYELAKELKDAGFPSKNPYNNHYWHNGKVESYQEVDDWAENYIGVWDNAYEIFTLSELLEACGERFYSLTYDSVVKWCCNAYPTTDYNHFGSTPEEAVARLWLALNKK